jgi:lipoate synthase
MDTVTVAKKIDELTMLVKQLAENIKQLSSAYSEILKTNVELRDYVKSGQYAADFKEVIDFVRKIKVQQQPNVKVEEYVPDYPLIGALYQKQIIVGDVYRKKMRVDHARLIHAILTNKLSSIEKAVAVKLLSQRGGGSS